MKGFASQALILLPATEKYNEYYGGYKAQFDLAVRKIIDYFKSMDTEPCFLVTDPVAATAFADIPGIGWLATENTGGIYFLKTRCGLQDVEPLIQLPTDIIEELDKKFPIERGLTVEQRWYKESKRVALAEKMLIARNKVVVLFGNQYNLRAKPNDGRALFFVNQQLIPKLKLSGNDANIASFTGITNANMAITEWRVNDAGSEGPESYHLV